MSQSIHDIPTLINQYIATSSPSDDTSDDASSVFIAELVNLITSDEITLLQFISSLGKTLTSDTDMIRSKAISCLSRVFADLPINKLSRQDVGVMVDFMVVKLDDKLSLTYVLQALNSLVKMNNFNSIDKVLKSLLDSYSPKKNLAKIRYETFLILGGLLESKGQYISTHTELADLYVKAFVHIASGEKDPRNLINSFSLNTKINSLFTFDANNNLHQQLIDDLFDVCFCYFPITFTPPPNDPYKITSNDLKSALRETIASQSLFATDAIANLIEKLTSTNPAIRNDVLTTLNLCVQTYAPETVDQHWVTIWNAVKFEVLHNTNELPVSASKTIIPQDYEAIDDNDDIKAVVLTLVIVRNLLERATDPQSMLEMILHELTQNLTTITNKTKLAAIILGVMAETSLDRFNYIVEQLFSHSVWGKYLNVEQTEANEEQEEEEDIVLNIERQGQLVDNLEYIFLAYYTLAPEQPTKLSQYKDHILIFLGQLLKSNVDTSLPKKVIAQFVNMIGMANFLTTQELELIMNHFQQILLNESTSETVVDACVSGLIGPLSEPRITKLAIELIITPLLATLDDTSEIVEVETRLAVIGKLCVNYAILEVISIKSLARLSSFNNLDLAHEDKIKLFHVVIDTLIKLINQVTERHQFLTDSWYGHFVPPFLNNIFKLLGEDTRDYALIESSSRLVGLIIRYIEKSKHQAVLNDFIEVFTTEKSSKIKLEGNLIGQPSGYIVMFNKIVASIDKECQFENLNVITESMVGIVKSVNNEYLRIQYLEGISLLVNKFTTDVTSLVDMSLTDPISYEIYIWILKGLILKLDPVGLDKLQQLVNQFTSGSSGITPKSFRVLFIDIDIFTETTSKHISGVRNLNVRLLYKQRIFQIVVPELLPHVDNHNCLVALALIIENVSTSILIRYLSTLGPVIMACVNETTNAVVLKSGLSMINVVLEEDDTILDPYVTQLVPVLLQIATTKIVSGKKRINDESIRVLALRNLTILFKKGHGDKTQALNQLRLCLDDKKRSVRKLAIDLCQSLYELK
ncbi:uncharacterized protein SPAPADRAFT_56167 [Spathaspora passalidarum NRRL Y-27907]|uniref:MMS19 nucleotide excision repair protein n=1 Tax=Spathaspora passalidarum (strain NRRL Y-27907 / 11-Y1) TaxID=619300 RepID=G3ARG7_SPAPN|nr:uncharacterized protein SPAPADRAFT_56167 [Spathaspora passalidarum NRRL Y-27907]EGW31288.1 hypothetical protein SPAPADRAFT_56167 [Spathaspora passalidarum NRRL Y-27907]